MVSRPWSLGLLAIFLGIGWVSQCEGNARQHLYPLSCPAGACNHTQLEGLQIFPYPSQSNPDYAVGIGRLPRNVEKSLLALGIIQPGKEPNHRIQGAGSVVLQSNPPSWGLKRISEHSRRDRVRTFAYPETAGQNVTVYVLDTGINIHHADLRGRASWGKTFGSNITTDDNGHGTFVAGIIAGTVYGVAKSSKVVAVKVLDSQRSGYLSHIVQGLNWTMSKHVPGTRTIVNLSLDTPKSDILNQLIASAVDRGIMVVGSAGNGDRHGKPLDACTRSPGSASAALTVGATDSHDRVARFSNFGSCVDILAPGVTIRSLSHDSVDGVRSDEGTSFAASYVAGVAALILGDTGEHNILAPGEVRNRIYSSATRGAIRAMGPNDGVNMLLFAGGWRGAQEGMTVPPSGDEEEEEEGSGAVSIGWGRGVSSWRILLVSIGIAWTYLP